MPAADASRRYIQEKNIRIVIDYEISKIKLRSSPIKSQITLTSDIRDKTINPTQLISTDSNIITKIDRFMPKMQIISQNISQTEPEIIW